MRRNHAGKSNAMDRFHRSARAVHCITVAAVAAIGVGVLWIRSRYLAGGALASVAAVVGWVLLGLATLEALVAKLMMERVEEALRNGASLGQAVKIYWSADSDARAPASVVAPSPSEAAIQAVKGRTVLDPSHVGVLQALIFNSDDLSMIRMILQRPDALADADIDRLVRAAVETYQVACSHTYFKRLTSAHEHYLPIRKLAEAVIRKLAANRVLHPHLAAVRTAMRERELAYDPLVDDSAFQIAQRRSHQLAADLIDTLLEGNT
jgi:hypothetical protein